MHSLAVAGGFKRAAMAEPGAGKTIAVAASKRLSAGKVPNMGGKDVIGGDFCCDVCTTITKTKQ
jgi:hypothetical protein